MHFYNGYAFTVYQNYNRIYCQVHSHIRGISNGNTYVKHPVPCCHVVLSPPTAAVMTTQALLAQQMQHECPLKYGELNQSHCLSGSSLPLLICSLLFSLFPVSESVHEKRQSM